MQDQLLINLGAVAHGFATVFAIWYPQTVSKLKLDNSRFKTYYDRCIEKATEKMLLFGGLKFEPTSMTRIRVV